MNWNYRVMKTKEFGYGIHEVFYTEEGKAEFYAERPEVWADSLKLLKQELVYMAGALNKKQLRYPKDFISKKEAKRRWQNAKKNLVPMARVKESLGLK